MEPRFDESPWQWRRRGRHFSPHWNWTSLFAHMASLSMFLKKKCNTAAGAKQRETAWENIAARVNACNHAGEKRTWLQLKMKYKNIVQTANRKKADARKTGGGRAPPPLTEAEALALSQNFGRPATEGIPGGSSSSEPTPQDTSAFITYSDGAICLVEPPHATTDLVTDEECEETLSAAFTEGEPERPVEGMAGQQQEGPSTSTAQIDTVRWMFSKHQRFILWNSCATV
ncbi:uncharacterized protein LOC117817726 isoform X2 [Notolabrus celidotus]|uniref:uncharacterized protein LOC117817726 isoform X2 n=1 Tax=Notolabrus celidotus TaxID=1203425 RepID=UPI00148FC3F9|nr:uncharacterized protein LOC117817726 isoform X2 [Notolabrus celidotus]